MTMQTSFVRAISRLSARGCFSILGLAFSVMPALASESLRGLDRGDRIQNEYLVVLKETAVARARQEYGTSLDSVVVTALSGSLAHRYGGQVLFEYSASVRGFALELSDERAVKALSQDPSVAFVEANFPIQGQYSQTPAPGGLDRIDQRYLPLDNTYNYFDLGAGVRVYVIDSGVRATHNELWVSGTRTTRVLTGYTAIADGNGTNDCEGHGTHVAGTIAGLTYGVAKSAWIVPVRVYGCTTIGSAATVVAGIDWVAANRVLPAVANLSIGLDRSFDMGDTMGLATSALSSVGVTVVTAAGNQFQDACDFTPAYVGASSGIITVANSTNADAREVSSSFGACVDLFAPGTSVTSAWYTSNSATVTMTGTSMSAAHVSGAAALYLSANPTSTPATVESAILYASTANVITNPAGSPNRLLYIGFGSFGGTPSAGSVPGAVASLDAICNNATHNLFLLDWSSASGDVGQYRIERSSTATGPWSFWGYTNASTTTFSVTGSGTRFYRVQACNGLGCGGYSPVTVVVQTPIGSVCP